MSLLTMMQDISDIVGLNRPGEVAGSTDQQMRTLLALANVEGKSLSKRHDWSELSKEATWTTAAQESQGLLSAIATDIDHIVNDTIWNRSLQDRMDPVNAVQWNLLKSSTASGPYPYYRIKEKKLLLIPSPAAGKTGAFEYISSNWCQSSSGTGQAAWAADADTGVLDEYLMSLGIVWRFKQSQGLDYSEDFQNYEIAVSRDTNQDGGRSLQYLDSSTGAMYPRVHVPEGSWSL